MPTTEERQRKQRRPIQGRYVYYLPELEGARPAIIVDIHQHDRMDSVLTLFVLGSEKAEYAFNAKYGPNQRGCWWWMD